jgi:hypothetical protein
VGDGGGITGYFISKKGKKYPFTGVPYGSGQGTMKSENTTYPLRFAPFIGSCNTDLNFYGHAAGEIISNDLLKKASKTLYDHIVTGLEKSLSTTLQTIQTWRLDPSKYRLAGLSTFFR